MRIVELPVHSLSPPHQVGTDLLFSGVCQARNVDTLACRWLIDPAHHFRLWQDPLHAPEKRPRDLSADMAIALAVQAYRTMPGETKSSAVAAVGHLLFPRQETDSARRSVFRVLKKSDLQAELARIRLFFGGSAGQGVYFTPDRSLDNVRVAMGWRYFDLDFTRHGEVFGYVNGWIWDSSLARAEEFNGNFAYMNNRAALTQTNEFRLVAHIRE